MTRGNILEIFLGSKMSNSLLNFNNLVGSGVNQTKNNILKALTKITDKHALIKNICNSQKNIFKKLSPCDLTFFILISCENMIITPLLSQGRKVTSFVYLFRSALTFLCGIFVYGVTWILLGQSSEKTISPNIWKQFMVSDKSPF